MISRVIKDRKWLVLPASLVIVLLANGTGVTRSSLIDPESSGGNTFEAWTYTKWTQTTQPEFEEGVLSQVDTSSSTGDALLAIKGDWYDADWTYRRQITIDHTAVDDVADPSTTYAGFPVLVYATGLSNVKDGGADIRFTSSNGVGELPREIESYSGGTLYAWVKVTLTKDASDSGDDVIYMYYGNDAASEPAPDSTYGSETVWDSNHKGVWHLNEIGTGISGEYEDSTSNANDGTLTGLSVLNPSFAMTTSGNSYIYEDLTSVTNYTIATGDYVEYDVYWTSSTDLITFDYTLVNGTTTLRDSGATDQNGLSAHPSTDLSAYALNKWYHRKIAIPVGHIGGTIAYFDIACEYDVTATNTAYMDNIRITNGGLTKKLIYSSGDSPTHSTHISSNGAINSFASASDPTLSYSTGKCGNALSNAVRYANMTARATNVQDNWTIEAWINPGILSQFGMAVYNGNDAAGYGFGIGNGAGDSGSKLSGLYGGVIWIDSGYTFVSADTWYHVVMTRASGTVRFYVNGTQTAGTSTSTPNVPNNYLTIGNELDSSSTPLRYFNGMIDEVRISDTNRSRNWIKTEYNNQESPVAFCLVGGEVGPYVPSGSLASQVLDSGVSGAVWDSLFWDETLPGSTDITFEVRASDTLFLKDAGTPSWTSVGGTFPIVSGLPSGRYIQWRATLDTSDTSVTPNLREVRVYYY